MTAKHAKIIRDSEEVRKRLAKLMVLQCFRNSNLENLHSGRCPDSRTGDYTDVKVVTPYGEIAWNDLSRFNDAEMKALIRDVVNHTFTWLTALFCAENTTEKIISLLQTADVQPDWDEPELV